MHRLIRRTCGGAILSAASGLSLLFMVGAAFAGPDQFQGTGHSHSSERLMDEKHIREEFFHRLDDLKSTTKRKEFLITNYVGLTEAIKKIQTAEENNQKNLTALEQQNKEGEGDRILLHQIKQLSRARDRLQHKAISLQMIKEFCVEEYLVLSSLEELDSKYKANSLSKADYAVGKRDLLAEWTDVKERRRFENLSIVSAVHDVEEELRDIEPAITHLR